MKRLTLKKSKETIFRISFKHTISCSEIDFWQYLLK